jgi:predicted DNA-binding transcriptional regulator
MGNYYVSFVCFVYEYKAFYPEGRVEVNSVFRNGILRRIFEQEGWTEQGMESVFE